MSKLAVVFPSCDRFSAIAFWLRLGVMVAVSGCNDIRVPSPSDALESFIVEEDQDELRRQLDEVLQLTLQDRKLNSADHAAWQIFHGILAYQHEFPLQIGSDGPTMSALEHILGGGKVAGWEARPGDLLDPTNGRRGLRAVMEPGSKSGQGHSDQWLAILAQCGLPPEQTIRVNDAAYSMADYVTQVQRDVPRNLEREWSWTLIGLTTYLPTTASWTASDGHGWSIERLVQSEAEQEVDSGACGGTHRLIGLAMALNRHLDQGGTLQGAWALADGIIRRNIDIAKRLQNPDGSFSTNYFARGGQSPDLADTIGTTGHTLEFLAIAMTDEQLAEPWVRRAAFRMCDVFRKTKELPLECGALYHAAHGLLLYRNRVFGPQVYSLVIAPRQTLRRRPPTPRPNRSNLRPILLVVTAFMRSLLVVIAFMRPLLVVTALMRSLFVVTALMRSLFVVTAFMRSFPRKWPHRSQLDSMNRVTTKELEQS